MLEIRGLDSFYGKAQILFNVSLSVDRGELVALLGRNGVGKTTLLKSIMGIEVARRGRIVLDGIDITGMRTHRIASAGIAYVPDYTGLFPGMSVLENLQLALGRKRVDLAQAYELYPEIGQLLNRRADALSGGERKLVSIIRATLAKPKILLLDEPTEGVMPILVKKIYKLMDRLRSEGMAILLVEPGTRLGPVKEIATRISVMVGGRIVYEAGPENLEKDRDIVKKYLAV